MTERRRIHAISSCFMEARSAPERRAQVLRRIHAIRSCFVNRLKPLA